MSSVFLTAIVLACLLAGAWLGMALRATLPEHHLSQDSMDVIKLATGLMATLAALVLGLLISAANTSHNTIETEYRTALANIMLLDRQLAAYGPETTEDRRLLHEAFLRKVQTQWPQEDFGPIVAPEAAGRSAFETIEQNLLQLAPTSSAQRWHQSRALQLEGELAQIHWLLLDQQVGSALPTPLLTVLISWATAIFISFGMFARPNATVITSLIIAAVAVSGAIFMIMELGSPFTGLIQISSAPARATLALLGQ